MKASTLVINEGNLVDGIEIISDLNGSYLRLGGNSGKKGDIENYYMPASISLDNETERKERIWIPYENERSRHRVFRADIALFDDKPCLIEELNHKAKERALLVIDSNVKKMFVSCTKVSVIDASEDLLSGGLIDNIFGVKKKCVLAERHLLILPNGSWVTCSIESYNSKQELKIARVKGTILYGIPENVDALFFKLGSPGNIEYL